MTDAEIEMRLKALVGAVGGVLREQLRTLEGRLAAIEARVGAPVTAPGAIEDEGAAE